MNISEIQNIPMKDIEISDLNVRKEKDIQGIEELAESINKFGLLQPVVLTGELGKPKYGLVVGQRRYLAHEKLGLDTIRAIFCDEKDPLRLKMLSLSENMQRSDLNYADKAEAITSLYTAFGKDPQKVAKEIGIGVQTIIEYVNLEEQATPKIKELLRNRNVNKADAKRIISAAHGDPKIIDELAEVLPKLTKYEKDRAVNFGKRGKATTAQIIEKAKEPIFENTIILTLDNETDKALARAEEKLSKVREEIASIALEEWLQENGFLNSK